MAKNNYVCDCNIIHQDTVADAKHAMPNNSILQNLTTFYKLLGDQTRTKICFALETRELCVCDLANVLSMTKSSISHQLRLLKEHHIVKSRNAGKEVYYTLDDNHVRELFRLSLTHIKHQEGNQNVEHA